MITEKQGFSEEHDIQKNDFSTIRIAIREFNGHTYLDLRIYVRGDDNEFLPTRKGVTLDPSRIPDLIKHLQSLYGEWGKRK